MGGMPWRVTVASVSTGPRHGILRLGEPDDLLERQRIATEAAALAVVNDHGIPAPQLLASDPDGSQAGQPALLVSICPGTSRIPRVSSVIRLERFGAAAAALHGIELEATADLPVRQRPIEILDFSTGRDTSASAPFLMAAERRLAECEQPIGRSVLLHGDLWQGNTLWRDEKLAAIIDWDCAGVGHPGIDLASARLDAMLMFGSQAADAVLRSYQQHSRDRPSRLGDLAYFDIIAALATPPDMQLWNELAAGQGRPDLSAEVLVARRDAFLQRAIYRLG
jgi:aminoglycoside phosphotransferase (APT) family kinase protein